ncbi:ATP-binding protein [Risungbinella massiliensis]|uniref:ATP-binding protein n=1 Tax=Risungbinella massiliensis TaxID=1329796 RepID=UPI0005CC2EA6|nr:ATP-binding protein [Risungbinella massiliensis]
METVIFVGIQASGKSTFYQKQFFQTHIRINLDMLKTRHREKLLFHACLTAKQAVVIDNTNVTIEDRKKYIDLSREHEFQVIGYYFEPDFHGSVERNSKRMGKANIPLVGIKSTLKKLEPPSYGEGFDRLYKVGMQNNEFVVLEY